MMTGEVTAIRLLDEGRTFMDKWYTFSHTVKMTNAIKTVRLTAEIYIKPGRTST